MRDLKQPVVWALFLAIVSVVFFIIGGGASNDFYLGLSTEIGGAAALLVLLASLGATPERDIAQLREDIAEVKELLKQRESDEPN